MQGQFFELFRGELGGLILRSSPKDDLDRTIARINDRLNPQRVRDVGSLRPGVRVVRREEGTYPIVGFFLEGSRSRNEIKVEALRWGLREIEFFDLPEERTGTSPPAPE